MFDGKLEEPPIQGPVKKTSGDSTADDRPFYLPVPVWHD
jgi:hypothetical protein